MSQSSFGSMSVLLLSNGCSTSVTATQHHAGLGGNPNSINNINPFLSQNQEITPLLSPWVLRLCIDPNDLFHSAEMNLNLNFVNQQVNLYHS